MTSTITRRRIGISALATLAAPAILRHPADAAQFNYKFATNQPLGHPSNTRAQEAIDRIRDQSGGRRRDPALPQQPARRRHRHAEPVALGRDRFLPLSGLIVRPRAGRRANGVGFAFKDYKEVWAAMDGDFGANTCASRWRTPGSRVREDMGQRLPADDVRHEADQEPGRPQRASRSASR